MSDFTMDKIINSFSPSYMYLLKPTASQTKIFVFLLNQEGHDNLCK